MAGRLREICIPPLAAGLIRSLRATLRVEFRNREVVRRLRADGKNYIHAFWHGRLLLMPYSYSSEGSGKGITILISKHGDGELIARTMQRFGFDTTRGSTNEGAIESFKALVKKARAGFDIGYTPDGPRGPRYSVTAGPIQLARMTGLPIVPVAFSARKKKNSRAGIGSSCRRPSPARSFTMANRSSCRVTATPRRRNSSACSWNGNWAA